jgi:hypothetical protein
VELARSARRYIRRRQAGTAGQEIHLLTSPLQEGHRHTARLGQFLDARSYGRRVGDNRLKRSPGHEQVEVRRQHLLAKKTGVRTNRAATDDDELDPKSGQQAEEVDILVYS